MSDRDNTTEQPRFSERSAPRADRAHLPPGYIGTTTGELLPWSHARERLEAARVYWIATTRPNGRPHVTPVWGVWLDDRLYFDGSPETRRGRNLAQNPAVAVHIESNEGKDVVIVEGEVRELSAPQRALTERLAAAYAAKYASDGYAPEPNSWDAGGLYAMQPQIAIAWTDLPKATRWRFEGPDSGTAGS